MPKKDEDIQERLNLIAELAREALDHEPKNLEEFWTKIRQLATIEPSIVPK